MSATSTRYNGPADPTTPCNQCGGPTYTFVSGSIWCPSEACEPGGHFVRRVAFERKPGAAGLPRLASTTRKPSLPTTPKSGVKRESKRTKVESFDLGLDAFVRSE
jgi:hypothetical protein